jgi:hypothetical protein
MKIDSAAGEFEFDLQRIELAEDGIKLFGKMGVWEAETTMTDADLRRVLGLVLSRPGSWGYLLKLLFSVRQNVKQSARGSA